MRTVALIDADFPDRTRERELLAAAGVGLAELDRPDGATGLDPATVEGLLVMWSRVDTAVLDRYPRLAVVGRFGLGVDNIDRQATARRGVTVVNSGEYATGEVAAHTVALALALLRDVVPNHEAVRGGGWLESVRPDRLRRLTDLTVGVLGPGRIGRRVARAFSAGFGCRVVGCSPTSRADGVEPVSGLADLLAVSDLVTVHVPLTPATRGLIGADELARMPAGSYLVNTSRGGVVEESALADALRSGHLAGAGLDVFGTEPPPPDAPLRTLPNTVLSPHVGYLSGPSLLQARRHTVEDVLAVLDRRTPVHTLLPP